MLLKDEHTGSSIHVIEQVLIYRTTTITLHKTATKFFVTSLKLLVTCPQILSKLRTYAVNYELFNEIVKCV